MPPTVVLGTCHVWATRMPLPILLLPSAVCANHCDSVPSQRKRRKIDAAATNQALQDTKAFQNGFLHNHNGMQDAWQDFEFNYSANFMLQPDITSSAALHTSHLTKIEQTASPTPSDSLVCKWHDQTTGWANPSLNLLFLHTDPFPAYATQCSLRVKTFTTMSRSIPVP